MRPCVDGLGGGDEGPQFETRISQPHDFYSMTGLLFLGLGRSFDHQAALTSSFGGCLFSMDPPPLKKISFLLVPA